MSRLSIAFFGAAVVYGLVGMVLGMAMGASENFTLAPVHAHINLLGWATLALMGAFYGLAGAHGPTKLGWINFAVSNLGNLISLPLLAKLLLGDKGVIPVMAVGEVLIVIGMVLFGISILMVARRPIAA